MTDGFAHPTRDGREYLVRHLAPQFGPVFE
jgi:hypothetical protein